MGYNSETYRDGSNSTNPPTYSIRGSSNVITDAGTNTWSGTNTFSGTNTISGSVTVTGTLTNNGTVLNDTGATIKYDSVDLTTASTVSAMPQRAFVTIKSTKTADTFTVFGATVGTRMVIHCLNASATGFVRVNVDSSQGAASRTFDGANYLYDFKKAGESVEIMLVSTGRWLEIARSVADGTALTSTST